MYALIQLEPVRAEYRVRNFDIACSMLVGLAVASTIVLPQVEVSAKAKIRWIKAKYLLAASVLVTVAIIKFASFESSPMGWLDILPSILFIPVFIFWLIDEATKEIKQRSEERRVGKGRR